MTEKRMLGLINYLSRFDDTYNSYVCYRGNLSNFLMWKYPDLAKYRERGVIEWSTAQGAECLAAMDQRSRDYVGDPERDFVQDLIDFKNSLKKRGMLPKSIGRHITSVTGFLERNGITIASVDRRDLKRNTSHAVTQDRVPTAEELLRVIDFLPLQVKAAVMILTCGPRPGEVLQLKVGDIHLEDSPAWIRIRDNGQDQTTKTRITRLAYLTDEAAETLRQYLEYRPKYMAENGKLVLKNGDKRVFPYSDRSLNKTWNVAVEKAGYSEKDGRIRSMHLYTLRKYFRTRGNWVSTDVAEYLLGHRSGLGPIYDRLDQNPKEVIRVFREAEKHLSIYSRASLLEVEELRSKYNELKSQKDTRMDSLEKSNAELTVKVDEAMALLKAVYKNPELAAKGLERRE